MWARWMLRRLGATSSRQVRAMDALRQRTLPILHTQNRIAAAVRGVDFYS